EGRARGAADGRLATFLDFSKAFDRVDWNFMFGCMTQVGIPPEFTRWVRLMYMDPVVSIFINGHKAPPIWPNRGVKQGCPLSPLLFVLTIEPLSEMLRAKDGLGIPLPCGYWTCGALFADDVTLFSDNPACLVDQLEIVEAYCAGSGAQLNRDKSKTIVLNNQRPVGGWPGLNLLINLDEVSTLWRDIWTHWYKLPWSLKSRVAPMA
uniref:Reverse transcriptase domain-containing protein n=1 Tax=Hucho hucho TaxID=62062 RepID=A0A4W5LH34_9TELE